MFNIPGSGKFYKYYKCAHVQTEAQKKKKSAKFLTVGTRQLVAMASIGCTVARLGST
jgi:hypothetical protein